MSRRSRLEWAAVLLVIGCAMFYRLDAVGFDGDESCKIGYSAPFEAFAAGRYGDPIWRTREDKYLNPVLTYYVIGAARRVGGFDAARLNLPWDFSLSDAENRRLGRVPEPGLLWWGRAGVTAAACSGVFTIFLLMRRASGRWTAVAWLALTLASPFLRVELRRALNEGVLLATVALTMWSAFRALQELEGRAWRGIPWPAAGWLVAAGIGAGLSAQTKLNGGAAAAGVWVLVLLSSANWPTPWRTKVRVLLLATSVLAASSAFAFVGTNPSLWPHPARETARMVRARVEVMKAQTVQYRQDVIGGASARVTRVPVRVLHTHAALPAGPLNVVFFAIGTGASLLALAHWMRAVGRNHARIVLTVVGAAVSAPALLTPFDWPRYFVLPVVFSSVQVVFGMEWLAVRAWRALSAQQAGR